MIDFLLIFGVFGILCFYLNDSIHRREIREKNRQKYPANLTVNINQVTTKFDLEKNTIE